MNVQDAEVLDSKPASDKNQKWKFPPAPGGIASKLRFGAGVVVWIYVFVKLFVFDADRHLFILFGNDLMWILENKFVILLSLLAVVVLWKGVKWTLKWSAYFALFPFIAMFWELPIFLFRRKQWVTVFAFVSVSVTFIKSLKYRIAISAAFMVSITLAVTANIDALLWVGAFGLFFVLIVCYARRFWSIIRPSDLYRDFISIPGTLRERQLDADVLDGTAILTPVEALDADQLKRRISTLTDAVVYNRMCLFVARKLRDYQHSGVSVSLSVLAILFLAFLTVLSFSGINYALYKLDPTSFKITESASFFDFFYYSFNGLVFNHVAELTPATRASQSAWMLQLSFVIFLTFFLVTLAFSVLLQRRADELNSVIQSLETEGTEMEEFIRSRYQIGSMEDAISELREAKSTLLKLIFFLTERISK